MTGSRSRAWRINMGDEYLRRSINAYISRNPSSISRSISLRGYSMIMRVSYSTVKDILSNLLSSLLLVYLISLSTLSNLSSTFLNLSFIILSILLKSSRILLKSSRILLKSSRKPFYSSLNLTISVPIPSSLFRISDSPR